MLLTVGECRRTFAALDYLSSVLCLVCVKLILNENIAAKILRQLTRLGNLYNEVNPFFDQVCWLVRIKVKVLVGTIRIARYDIEIEATVHTIGRPDDRLADRVINQVSQPLQLVKDLTDQQWLSLICEWVFCATLSQLMLHISHQDQPLTELFRGPQIDLVSVEVFNFNFRFFLPLIEEFIDSKVVTSRSPLTKFILDRSAQLQLEQDVMPQRRRNLIRFNDQRLNLILYLGDHSPLLRTLLLTLTFFLLQ